MYCKIICPNETTVQFEDNFIANYHRFYNTSSFNGNRKEEKND